MDPFNIEIPPLEYDSSSSEEEDIQTMQRNFQFLTTIVGTILNEYHFTASSSRSHNNLTLDHRMAKPSAQTSGERDPDFWPLCGKPYFHLVLKHSNVGNPSRLTIPRHLSENLPVARIPAKILYRGKVWDLQYLGNQGATNCRLENQSWGKFVTDNNLIAGDVCVFELVEGSSNSKSIKFKVQVFKDEFPEELCDKAEGSKLTNPIFID